MKNKLGRVELLRTLVAIGISLLIVLAVILLISDEPIKAISSFILGPLSSVRRMGNVVELMIPLMFTGLATIVLFRVGLFNLSVEGSFFAGIVVATVVSLVFKANPIITLLVSIAAATLTGGFITTIPGLLKVKCNSNEIVTSLMLNYVVLNIGLFVIQDYFRDPQSQTMYSYKFPEGVELARIIPGTRIHLGLVIVLALIIAIHFLLERSSFGYTSKLVGSNFRMANYSGLNSEKTIILSQWIGGLIAGLGGAVELFGMYSRFQYYGLTGYGWDGILIAIVARAKPKLVPVAAFFLAYLRIGADIMSRENDVPFELIQIVQAIVIVLISAQVILSKYRKKVLKEEADRIEKEVEAGQHG